ncbi:hypothetical protein [Carp edema virus]|nr:hypothetical protein [Carp edema virus]
MKIAMNQIKNDLISKINLGYTKPVAVQKDEESIEVGFNCADQCTAWGWKWNPMMFLTLIGIICFVALFLGLTFSLAKMFPLDNNSTSVVTPWSHTTTLPN